MINKNKRKNNIVIRIRMLPIILCIITIVVIISSINPTISKKIYDMQMITLYAEQDWEAIIGEDTYETLEEAIEKAKTNDTISLLKNVTVETLLTISEDISIDLNDNYLELEIGLINNGKLTLKNGVIYGLNTTADNNVITNNDTLTLVDIEISGNENGLSNNSVLNFNDDNIIIKAKNPIKGSINNIISNHAVRISTDTDNSSLKVAKVIHINSISDADLFICGNILYDSIYTAINSIDVNITDEIEVKLLKDMTTYKDKNYIKIGTNQKIKLNLNGKKLYLYSKCSEEETTTAGIINEGTLTIENGIINESNEDYKNFIKNKGALNINDIKLYNGSESLTIINMENETKVTGVVDCSIKSTGGKVIIEGTLNGEIINGTETLSSQLSIISGTINGTIENYGTLTIGTNATNIENRPIIKGRIENNDNKEIIINNGEISTETGHAITTHDNSRIIMKDGLIKSNNGNPIHGYGDDIEIFIEKGEVLAPDEGLAAILIENGTVNTATVVIGVDDRVVIPDSPRIKGEVLIGRQESMQYYPVSYFDGIIEDAWNDTLANYNYRGENEEYYAENFEIINDKLEDGTAIVRYKDIKDPEFSAKVLADEGTYNTIKLKINATDSGFGLDRYEISYQNVLESTINKYEANWKETEDNINYVTLTGLEKGSKYIIKITIYDKEGNDATTPTYMEASTTSGIDSISIEPTTMNLKEGEQGNLTAKISPSTATNQSVEWNSSDPTVATVQDGLVTAIKAGTATITVTTVDGEKTATCTVTVTEPNVPVEGVTLNKNTLNLVEGTTETLTATVNPDTATNKEVRWSTSESTVATVDQNGKVTALGAGTATITVTTEDGGKTATCTVTVTEPSVPVTGVTLNKSSLSLVEGGTETLVATVTPSSATNKKVTWSTSKNTVATVDQNGKVTAVRAGTATITVTTEDGGKTATCTVTVTEPTVPTPTVSVTGVTLNKSSISLVKGNTETLIETVNPTGATNKNVTWSSSENTIATVDQNGKVTAVGAGTATITVTTEDGGYTATCTVTVTEPTVPTPTVSVTGVTLNKSSISLFKGNTETLTATVNPTGATNKNVTWTSSEDTIATVDSNGKVTAVSVGTATITVTTVDGGKTATCTVTVTDNQDKPKDELINITNISIDKAEISLYTGESQTLKLTINPSDASIEKIIYTSSNTDVATVDVNGRITAKGKGTTTITVVVVDKNGNSFAKECKVTVKKAGSADKDDGSDKDSDKDKDKDTTIADKILPSTGLGKAILAGTIVLIINGIVMLIKYRKMKDI